MRVQHPFPPVVDEDCRILILGSFPSVKSREDGFFYGHPQNRFWKMLSVILDEPIPTDIDAKRRMLLRHHIALWDVIASCQIAGSSDASIQDAVPVDTTHLFAVAPIERILCNGALAGKLYRKHLQPITKIDAITLPSTSPANASWTLPRLIDVWHTALQSGT